MSHFEGDFQFLLECLRVISPDMLYYASMTSICLVSLYLHHSTFSRSFQASFITSLQRDNQFYLLLVVNHFFLSFQYPLIHLHSDETYNS